MSNLFSPLSADSTTITDDESRQKMGCSQNSQLSTLHKPLITCFCACASNTTTAHLVPPQHCNMVCPLYPFCFCQTNNHHNQIENQNQRSWLLQPNHDRRLADAYKTKVARNKRKLARQKSLSRNPISSSSSSSCPSSIQIDPKRLALINNGANNNSQGSETRDLYTFYTSDNKKLRVLLKKELKNSDVGGLGRIVLPKREAEENLPTLSDKDGIQVVIRDVYSTQEWSLKFKYWSNNKSRMYVLENTGDFVKQNGLEIGDSLTLYEDESKNLYFSVKKVETEEPRYAGIPAGGGDQGREEEEASFALLIEQLKHKEQQEHHSLVTLSMDIAPPNYNYNSHRLKLGNNSIMFNNAAAAAAAASSNDHHNVVDDCYTGLGLLPDVNWYNFSL